MAAAAPPPVASGPGPVAEGLEGRELDAEAAKAWLGEAGAGTFRFGSGHASGFGHLLLWPPCLL